MVAMQGEPPAVARRRVRFALRRFRGESGLNQTEVAKRLGWSLSKMQRIELGEVGVSSTDLLALLQVYGVDDPEEIARLAEDARTSRRQRWWMSAEYREHLTPGLRQLVQFESEATAIRVYQPFVVPGVVQTRRLAEFILGSWGQGLTDEQRRVRLEVRMARKQQVIHRAGAPRYLLVLDESVLLRDIGGEEVMAEQFEDLAEVARLPNVHIRVVPLNRGTYAGNLGPFQIISLGDDDDHENAVMYEESYTRDFISHEASEIEIRRTVFEKLWEHSRSEDATRLAIVAQAASRRSRLQEWGDRQ